jgi:two-component system, sensor histidine kinase LadS
MKTRLLFCVFLALSFTISVAQSVVQVDDATDERILTLNELAYYIDSTNQVSFNEISSSGFQVKFLRHSDYQNTDFRPNTSYWVKFPLHLNPESRKEWLLEFYDQSIDHLELYIPQQSGNYRKLTTGDSYEFSNRIFRHKNFETPIDMFADSTVNCYFKVKSHEFADIRIAFRSVDRFVFYALNEYILYGMFYGMIIIISLYNFLVYLAIKEIKNIYYIFYILSVALYAASLDGIGFQYLWPSFPQINDYIVGISLYSLIVWALIFTRRFLSTRANAPELDKALVGMIIARSISFVVILFFFPRFLTYRNLEIIPLSLIFYTGIRVWIGNYKPARFFVIAYGILFAGFFLRILVQFNVLPFTILSHYSLHISFGVEMLFLTFALGDRIRILKDNRDRALRRIIHQHEVNMQLKDKVNRELEQKVQERTVALNEKNHELEDTNRKLERQSTEINEINSILDLDNWKLKNSIKEVLSERLMEKTMDYNQFKQLYPDTLSCYRFLENLKWEKGYRCKKCHNEKFFDGAQKFAKRCTKCGYNESITAFTIFHAIKFPIEKAFYLAYLTVAGRKDLTLEMLAESLDLRVNTVWSFKHKIAERIQFLEIKGFKPHTSRWQEVILTSEAGKSSLKNRENTYSLPEK